MLFKFRKQNLIFMFAFVFSLVSSMSVFAMWVETEKGEKFWYETNGTIAEEGWKLIDDDNDGVGYYYFFRKGFLVVDDITPDYKIVDSDGKRIGYDGNPESEKIDTLVWEEGEKAIYSADIAEQLRSEQDLSTAPKGIFSSGQFIISKDPTLTDGPTPADNIVIEQNADGTARYLLGGNVVLRDDKKSNDFDSTISKKMVDYIKSGDKYSKKVNGTTFNKQKWKEVMALKGTGASIVFENPKNNFNKIKGRIATHYFTYSDRTTTCTLTIFNEDDGEELYTTSDFNYNSGSSFECVFPRKASAIRFELEVSGQYTSRVCYLRNCEFAFDRDAFEEEQYDYEVEMEYRRKVGTVSEATYDDDYGEDDPRWALGEVPKEGEDPGQRYKRLNGMLDDEYWLNFNYDEGDDVPDAIKASISEARKRAEAEALKRDNVSGPAFDKKLLEQTEAVGPDGSKMIIEAFEGD